MGMTPIRPGQLNQYIGRVLRMDPLLSDIALIGEISNLKFHHSGHIYFSLKDDSSRISCFLPDRIARQITCPLEEGMEVIASGYIAVFERGGSYSLNVTDISAGGKGELAVRFEQLKAKLSAEGLFDPSRKKLLPMVPRKVAVVTSGSGAAWHDILNVSALRDPTVPIVLIPVTVQGDRAAAEIAAGIRIANEQTDADVVIVARGGGSAEDLWCFNDENVARDVAGSRIPVVSGVGHEIDTTICDLAADVRASTPSNAAEIVFPDRKELTGRTNTLKIGLRRAAESEISRAEARIRDAVLRLTFVSPEKRIARLKSESSLRRSELIRVLKARLERTSAQHRLTEKALTHAAARRVDAAEAQVLRLRERLEAINPLQVLQRGYALVTDRGDKVLTGVKEAYAAGNVRIRFADGTAEAAVRKDGST